MGACTWSEIFEEERLKREKEQREPTGTELLSYGGGREKEDTPPPEPAPKTPRSIWDRINEGD